MGWKSMSCELIDKCPSASPTCRLSEAMPAARCVGFLISAWELEREARERIEFAKNTDVLYLCDQTRCENCSAKRGECFHTVDVSHAKNFALLAGGFYYEKKGGAPGGEYPGKQGV